MLTADVWNTLASTVLAKFKALCSLGVDCDDTLPILHIVTTHTWWLLKREAIEAERDLGLWRTERSRREASKRGLQLPNFRVGIGYE